MENIQFIRDSDANDLKNSQYVEKLMLKLGLNSEILDEQPLIVHENTGGLKIWQYPNQFSKYITFLGTFDIKSYIEIGCRWGGTFILTVEYLKRFNNIEEAVAVDLLDYTPVKKYCDGDETLRYMKINSQSNEFSNFIKKSCLLNPDKS